MPFQTPRRVAIPLIPTVKAELRRMQELGVISKVTEPTDWCAGMVVVPPLSQVVPADDFHYPRRSLLFSASPRRDFIGPGIFSDGCWTSSQEWKA